MKSNVPECFEDNTPWWKAALTVAGVIVGLALLYFLTPGNPTH